MSLRVGVDLDNTLIDYGRVLRRIARSRGWIAAGERASKRRLKSILIRQDGDDRRWQSLQAEAYGRRIMEAAPMAGSLAFLRKAAKEGRELFIVSHKSESSRLDPSVHLRDRAMLWLRARRIVGGRGGILNPKNVLFAATRSKKIGLIRRLALDFFIDDLRAVLDAPAFPRRTLGFHFASDGPGPRQDCAAAVWRQAAARIDCAALCGLDAYRAIVKTFGQAPLWARPLNRGGNNRLFQLRLPDGRRLILKNYPPDGRPRARAEHDALELMRQSGLRNIPRHHYLDPGGRFALLSRLPGRPMSSVRIRPSHVRQAVDFLAKLHRLRLRARGISMREAAESRRRLADYPAAIERRLRRIRAGLKTLGPRGQSAGKFLRRALVPLKKRLVAEFCRQAARQGFALKKPLAYEERALSPSDFGFHNALLGENGRIFFVDFEYFGWDDPAKLAADFLNHAGQRLSARAKTLFLDAYGKTLPDPKSFRRRLRLVMPLVAFEWILIILNIFESGPRQKKPALLRARLRKAVRMAAALERR